MIDICAPGVLQFVEQIDLNAKLMQLRSDSWNLYERFHVPRLEHEGRCSPSH